MKHLRKYNESLGKESIILDLKDMALELIDMGYNVQILEDEDMYGSDFKKWKGQETDDKIRIIINNRNNFTMKTDVKEFLFRAIGYMEDNGYIETTHSNFGKLHFTEDGRIILSSGEVRERYPSFTQINILFKKD